MFWVVIYNYNSSVRREEAVFGNIISLPLSRRAAALALARARAGARREDPGSLKCSLDRFTVDFLSILPVHYIQLIVDGIRGGDGESSSYTRALKILRLLRLAKLLRIARLKKLLEKYEDAFDASQYMGLLLTLFIILFMAHIMAW